MLEFDEKCRNIWYLNVKKPFFRSIALLTEKGPD
jgi:hypothetical protein